MHNKIYYKIVFGYGYTMVEEPDLVQKVRELTEFAEKHSDLPMLKIVKIIKITEEEIDINTLSL